MAAYLYLLRYEEGHPKRIGSELEIIALEGLGQAVVFDDQHPRICGRYRNLSPVAFSPNEQMLLTLRYTNEWFAKGWVILDWRAGEVVFERNFHPQDCVFDVCVPPDFQYIAECRTIFDASKTYQQIVVWSMPAKIRKLVGSGQN